ncbi:conjugal transfer ATP-binding protein TraC [Escherichia coli]|uniref:Conjugal transfer ATP-binding protein TraC n=1 Tax=Escherichia coli TaxID=562 RepID=A0A376ZVD3_ECOLX|nr:conjugal transfer ATP-binding protein TraC [Escherichia coli]
MRNFLTCLPFMAGKGLFKQLKEAGVVQRAESFNVANLMPLVADNPLTPAGLLAPTYRNQLAFIDIFFRGMNNTNYNMAVCGTSGAGKNRADTATYPQRAGLRRLCRGVRHGGWIQVPV